MQEAGFPALPVNGRRMISSGISKARCIIAANTSRGTASLSSGMGSPPSATWNTPAVVRRSLAGLWSTPFCNR